MAAAPSASYRANSSAKCSSIVRTRPSDRDRALQFGPAIDEAADRAFERNLRSGAIDASRARGELVHRSAAIGNDQRNSARASLGRDHAERLCLAAVHQRIGAGEETRKLATVADPRKHRHSADAVGEQLELRAACGPRRPGASRPCAWCGLTDRAHDHVPALLRGEAADAEQKVASARDRARQCLLAHRCRSKGRRKQAGLDAHPDGFGIVDAPGRSRSASCALAQTTVSNMRPSPRRCRQNQPNKRSICCVEQSRRASDKRKRQADRRASRASGSQALPTSDHRRARPGRRCLDVVRLPGVERRVDRSLVVEVAIALVHRHPRRRDGHQDRAWTAPDTSCRSPGAMTIISWPNRAAARASPRHRCAPRRRRACKKRKRRRSASAVSDCPRREVQVKLC